MVTVVFSAQNFDDNVNKIAPILFEAYPNMESVTISNQETLFLCISKVRNFGTKAKWLLKIAQNTQKDENIRLTMEGLVALKEIGR